MIFRSAAKTGPGGPRPGPAVALALAWCAAVAAGAAGDERFGVMTHFAQGWEPALVPLIANEGVRQVRDELYWSEIEAEKGVFAFPARYDTYLGALARHGITPLVVLSFENPHYDGGQTPYTDEGRAAFARYAVEVLRHCGPQVKAVEIWNEYNGSFNHGPATDDRAGSYLKMLRVAYAAIKRARPDVTVVGGATAGVPLPYWEKLLAGGGLECMDALSIHPYRYDAAPEGIEDDVAALCELAVRHGGAKPVWVTEIGWQLKLPPAAGGLVVDEATQAKFLVRAYALLLAAGVEHIYWYLFRDDHEFTMGLVRNDDDRTPKPAYGALATLARELAGATFVRREPAADGFYSLLFRTTAGGEKRILWSLAPRRLDLPGATAATDLAGRSLDPAGAMTLDDSPVYVTGPLRDLPAPAAPEGRLLADSARDFSGQGEHGWSYGYYGPGGTGFTALPSRETTDWKTQWSGAYPYLSITAEDQHPSATDGRPVTVVRRWQGRVAGTIRVTGSFRCGAEGDGVGVSVVIDGQPRFRKRLGGGAAVTENFDFVATVRPDTTLDFAVDPGPAAGIDFDATRVSVVIRQQQ